MCQHLSRSQKNNYYIVRNIITNEVVRRIDLNETAIGKFSCAAVHDTTFVTLDDTGMVSCLDIQSGVCTQQFQSGISNPY